MNDKSILIIPTPKDCEHCDLPFTIDEILGRVVCWEDEYGKHCPLRPLPSPLEENHNLWTNDRDEETFKEGFNRCLEVITGETE